MSCIRPFLFSTLLLSWGTAVSELIHFKHRLQRALSRGRDITATTFHHLLPGGRIQRSNINAALYEAYRSSDDSLSRVTCIKITSGQRFTSTLSTWLPRGAVYAHCLSTKPSTNNHPCILSETLTDLSVIRHNLITLKLTHLVCRHKLHAQTRIALCSPAVCILIIVAATV